MNIYKLMHDAYYGDGGFEGAYLTRHPRESDENHRQRIRMAYYLNYFAPIVNALVDPVFKKKPLRDWKGAASAVIDEFSNDVDGAGTDIANFMHRAALEAKLYGGVYIVVENYTAADLPGTLHDALAERKLPYAYTLSPDRVTEYDIDRNGKVQKIKFTDISVSSSEGDKERTVYFDTENWRVEENGHAVVSGVHGLGAVPVVFFPSQDIQAGEIRPTPELYPEARTAVAIYNHCSWLTEILRNQTFPILTFPDTQAKNLVIGTNNALCFDGTMSKFQPGFISPPSDPAQMLQSQIQVLIQEMYRMAGLTFVTGTRAESSGIARQWEFERTNQRLAEFAMRCAKAERAMIQMAALWMHMDIEYTVAYSSDFGITDIATELKNAQAVLDMNLAPDMAVEVARHVLSVYSPDIGNKEFDELIGAVETAQKEAAYNEPPPIEGT